MSTFNDMLNDWKEDTEIEDEMDVIGGNESSYIVGYGAVDVKITMAKLIEFKGKKSKWIELDMESKDGKTLRERFMFLGKDGEPSYKNKRTGKPSWHMGYSKLKSLAKVAGIHQDAKGVIKAIISNNEEAEVTYVEYGKEKTETFTVFPDLIGVKVKILVRSKKINIQSAYDEDDAYLKFCQKNTEAFKKNNPKKKAAQKFKKDDDYQNTYRWTTETNVDHFVSLDGLLQSEIGTDGGLMDKWLKMNDEGTIFDMRTLLLEDLSEGERKKFNLNEYGKVVEEDSDEAFEEPEEEAAEDDDSEW